LLPREEELVLLVQELDEEIRVRVLLRKQSA
jgi:hypothetical protein